METFAFARPADLAGVLAAIAEPDTLPIAGGTELLNWMKEGIVVPRGLIDINRLDGLDRVEARPDGLRIGALARMSDVARDDAVRRDYPVIAEALEKSASPQLRNMASLGGNLMQRTRCPYFPPRWTSPATSGGRAAAARRSRARTGRWQFSAGATPASPPIHRTSPSLSRRSTQAQRSAAPVARARSP